jgi:hypothetical protein
VYELVRRYFTEKEIVDLTLAIVAINGWNRLAVAFRTVPGTFRPGEGSHEHQTVHATTSSQSR